MLSLIVLLGIIAAAVAGIAVMLSIRSRAGRDDAGRFEFEDVRLPEAGSVVDEPCDSAGYTTVNVYHWTEWDCALYLAGSCPEPAHWRLGVRGNDFDFPALGALISSDANLAPGSRPGTSERVGSIRADRAVTWGRVQKIIEEFAGAGMYKVQIAAKRPGVLGGRGTTLNTWLRSDVPGPSIGKFMDLRISIAIGTGGAVRRSFMGRPVSDDAELAANLREVRANYMVTGLTKVPVVIDAAADIPLKDVVAAIDVTRREGIEEFRYEPAR